MMVTRRKVIAGAALVPLGQANVVVTDSAPKMKPATSATRLTAQDMVTLHRQAFHLVRQLHRRLHALVADMLLQEKRNDLTSEEALLIFEIGSAEAGYDVSNLLAYGGGHRKRTVLRLESLVERGFISVRKNKRSFGQTLVLRKKGREVFKLVNARCIERHGLMLSYLKDTKGLPDAVAGLRGLGEAWREIVLYRL